MVPNLASLKDFKCFNCKNYLSVPPIVVFKNEDEEYFCGRCTNFVYKENSNPVTDRQTLYEKFAKNLKFPCRYKEDGCRETLAWNDVKQHEENCRFRKFECLFHSKNFGENGSCKMKGTPNEQYFEHLMEHSEKIEEIHDLKIWENPKNQLLRMDLFDNIFLVLLLFLDNMFHVVLIGEDKKEPIEYRIEIYDETRRNSIISTRVSKVLPVSYEEIRNSGLVLNRQVPCPQYCSIHFMNDNKICDDMCKAEYLPCCDQCQEILKFKDLEKLKVCIENHKFCNKCFTEFKEARCVACAYNGSTNLVSFSESMKKEFLKKHYRCYKTECSFLGDIGSFEDHEEFCDYILKKPSEISKLNTIYPLTVDELFFTFEDTLFKFSKIDSENSFTMKISRMRKTNEKYKFQIDIINPSFGLMSFWIYPKFNFQKNCYSKNSIEIQKTMFSQYGHGSDLKLQFKLNISKI